jgi:hypothetical protein
MQEWQLTWIKPDMDVCDFDGKKIGTVAHVYRHELAADATDGPAHERDVIEVKTGLLGLGSHYWVPLDAVQDVTHEAVFLNKGRDELKDLGWDARPEGLAQPA